MLRVAKACIRQTATDLQVLKYVCNRGLLTGVLVLPVRKPLALALFMGKCFK